jgi:Glycerophosphoryl diester phosphodiesterase family
VGEFALMQSSSVNHIKEAPPLTQFLTIEDVQMTKDNVPIIYHDFLMSETGTDAPLHNISFDQVIFSPSQRAIDSR